MSSPSEPRHQPVLSSRVLVGALATPARLRVVAALVLGASTPAGIVGHTGLGEAEVNTALLRLVRAGVVTAGPDGLSVDPQIFADAARAEAPKPAPDDFGVTDPKVAAVLRAFLRDGRLVSIPAPGRKRLIVLEYLVVVFEPGRRYPEAEVNAILASYHPDTAALRRYLVNEELLSRADGMYWRSGGWVDVDE